MSNAFDTEKSGIPMNTMSEKEGREKAVAALSQVLANTFILYVKTHGFHWNVTGRMFHSLHMMFEEQYRELWLAADAIAERIRALGFPAPGSYQEFSKHSHIREAQTVPNAAGMIAELLSDHETCARSVRQALWIARSNIDAPTEDLLTQRLTAHEKAVWMLKSLLAEDAPVAMAQAA
jgi:starvation-inducible DNA-binding protein